MRETVGEPAPSRPGRGRRPAARESILDAIRASEQLSRVELAAVTGLTEAAVSMTVRRLLDEGLVVETGRTPTGGKPRTLLRLDPAARLAVGVHLDRDVTTFVLTGQTGGVISRLARPAPAAPPTSGDHRAAHVGDLSPARAGGSDGLPPATAFAGFPGAAASAAGLPGAAASAAGLPGATASAADLPGAAVSAAGLPGAAVSAAGPLTDDLLAHLVEGISTLLAGSGVDPVRCLGIGVVWPAPAGGLPPGWDSPPHLRDWDADRLGRRLAEETGWPVLVENDATAAAVGEYWVARVGPERAFAALYMGSGIGAGIVAEGRAMRGGHGAAGEFGHVCVQIDGPPCWCGSRGCLEILAGPRTVVVAARSDPAALAEAGLGNTTGRGVAADFAAVARAARAGAPRCLALLEDSARYVAAAAESVVNLLDVDLVVLTGPGFAAASFVYGPAIMRRVAPADTKTWRRSVTVTVSLAAATASATGAAALVLQSHLRR
ncbi:ROK family transcriptional regulator [Actinoplanes xinjiangensis]|uniref:ROK family transcriptional regulator n=1 Tax=Actinoplanes xinjiangensis TaxID=512350 RepID=UPI00343AEEDF